MADQDSAGKINKSVTYRILELLGEHYYAQTKHFDDWIRIRDDRVWFNTCVLAVGHAVYNYNKIKTWDFCVAEKLSNKFVVNLVSKTEFNQEH